MIMFGPFGWLSLEETQIKIVCFSALFYADEKMPFLHADPASCSQMAGGAYRGRCCPAVHNTRQTGRATSPWAGSTWQCVGRPQSSVEMLTWIMADRAHHSSSNANSSFLENVRPHPGCCVYTRENVGEKVTLVTVAQCSIFRFFVVNIVIPWSN